MIFVFTRLCRFQVGVVRLHVGFYNFGNGSYNCVIGIFEGLCLFHIAVLQMFTHLSYELQKAIVLDLN